MLTTGSFRVLQCNPGQKRFVAFGYVPILHSQTIEMSARYLPLNPALYADRSHCIVS